MYEPVNELSSIEKPVLVVSNGFEERATEGLKKCLHHNVLPIEIWCIVYPGEEHKDNLESIRSISNQFSNSPKYVEFASSEFADMFVAINAPPSSHFVFDVTGLSRKHILYLLTAAADSNCQISLIYTEAQEYFPLKADFDRYLQSQDDSTAFETLIHYEKSDVVYSSQCVSEDIDCLTGRFQPGLPLLLISFLTFKRSRLARVMLDYECNRLMLIKGVPVRKDLAWRERALEIINFDLVDEVRERVAPTSTLDWRKTYELLDQIYNEDHTKFRFNVLLAPLGGKLQTAAAWRFAYHNPAVKVVTSTPKEHFPERYSIGVGESFFVRHII